MITWLIEKIKNDTNIKMVAEVGVFQGETLKHYAPIIKERGGLIYAVDWFAGNVHEIYAGPQAQQLHYFRTDPQEIKQVYNNLLTTLREIDCLDIVKILRGNTAEQAQYIPDISLDLCFIDADHTYDGVIKDIQAYQNKVKLDGIFCGHDYEQSEVRRAVLDSFEITVENHSDRVDLIWIKSND